MRVGKLLISVLFVTVLFIYLGWTSGFTFSFQEFRVFPNYNMLAEAYAKGQLFLDERGLEDCANYLGKSYMYSGPVPALLRLPWMLLTGRGIPTGVAIAIWCAGVVVLFVMSLGVLTESGNHPTLPSEATWFTLVMAFNGYTLFVVAIPLFHHEAISSASLFLAAAVYLVVKVMKSGYRPGWRAAVLLGLSFSLCIGCRFSFVFAVGFLCIVLFIGMIRNRRAASASELIRNFGLIFGVTGLSIGLLLFYNFLRFENPLDFGIQYLDSLVFRTYFAHGNLVRYDHIPYNLWSIFFRLPYVVPQFPYLIMPAYVLKVKSFVLMPYWLLNANELAASVFCLMPVLVLAVVPLVAREFFRDVPPNACYWILVGVVGLQVLSSCVTVAATARYYFDFLPTMLIVSYMGGRWLADRWRVGRCLVVGLCLISVVVSFALPMNAVRPMYAAYIGYLSPLSRIFFPVGP